MKKTHPNVIVIHGGAGSILRKNFTREKEAEAHAALESALRCGYVFLEKGMSALDSVVEAVRVLEDHPLFNAGLGSVFTHEGKHQMDAAVMDGRNLGAGAVSACTRIKNPVTAARKILEESPHVMLSGKGADDYAELLGLELVEPEYFSTPLRFEQWQKVQGTRSSYLDHDDEDIRPLGPKGDEKFGTVGAVALDSEGNLAAATSTGGLTNKEYGRVGDSPIIGAGTYANNKTCAVSCTGQGEYFMRTCAAITVSHLMEYRKASLKKAANQVILKTLPDLGGSGGLIAVDREGNIAVPFNTRGMYRGWIDRKGKIKTAFYA